MLKFLFAVLCLIVFISSALPLLVLALRLSTRMQYFLLLFDPEIIQSLWQTLRISLWSLLLCLLLSLPLSWLLVRTDLRFGLILRRLLLFPYVLCPAIFAIAWVSLAVPEVGLLNRLGLGNWVNIYSEFGLVFVLSSAYLSIILSSLCAALESLDPTLEEAGRICGANPVRCLFKITIPCLLPNISSTSLLFLLAVMSAFGIPAIIGNPARLQVLTAKIYTFAKMGGISGTDQAFAISLWLLFLTFLFLGLNEWIRKRYQTRIVSGKASRYSVVALGKWRGSLLALVLVITFILVFLPIGAVFLSSFLKIAGKMEWSNLTTRNYHYLFFETQETGRAFYHSLWLSFLASLVCVLIAFFIAYFKDRTSFWGRNLLLRTATIPFAVPGTIIALACIISYGSGMGVFVPLLGSPLLLLVAYISKYLALSVQSITPLLSGVDPTLDEAGRVFGATPIGVIRRILFPLLLPTLSHVFLLTLLPVLTEITMSVLLAGPGTETIGMLLFQLQDYANPLAACSLASVLVVITGLSLPLSRRLAKKAL